MATPTSAKIEELRFRVKTDPKSRHFYPLAEELRKVGAHEEAEKVLRDGLATNPSYLSAWISLGRVLKETSRHNEAIESFQKAMTLDAENLVAARLSGECFLALGEHVEAIKKFKFVNALMPGDEEIENQIASLEAILSAPQSPANDTQPARIESATTSQEPAAEAAQQPSETPDSEPTPTAVVDDEFPVADDGYAATADAGYSPAEEDLFAHAEPVAEAASFGVSTDGARVVDDAAGQSFSVFESDDTGNDSADVFTEPAEPGSDFSEPTLDGRQDSAPALTATATATASGDVPMNGGAAFGGLSTPAEEQSGRASMSAPAGHRIDEKKAAAVARLLDWEQQIRRQRGE